jgi:hypothetical protein
LLALEERRKLKKDDSELYFLQKDSPHLLPLVNRSRVNWIGEEPPIPETHPRRGRAARVIVTLHSAH